MGKLICMPVLCLVLGICQQVAGGRIELHSNNLGGAYHRFHANRDVNQVSILHSTPLHSIKGAVIIYRWGGCLGGKDFGAQNLRGGAKI